MSAPPLSDSDLAAYFARIGFTLPPAPDLSTLAAIHRAHVLTIPFENLSIQLGQTIPLELPSIVQKLVHDGRGGYCFEHNALFHAVLSQMGFTVTPLAARVNSGQASVPPRSHMILRVDLAGMPYLADVGFGGRGLWTPLPLVDGSAGGWGTDAYRVHRGADLWHLQLERPEGLIDLYSFTEEPQHPIDYAMANHYVSTHPDSRFVQNLMVIRRTEAGRVILYNRELAIETATGTEKQPITDPAALLACLRETFGLEFPETTRFRRPEFA